ncbi:MAG: ATP-binding protein [Gammaproteobacteria bacterium]|nr:ATP-binding protein [Gammaproteobacteria bacterium]
MAISLSSIQKGGARKPPIMVLHGGPGIGKTTFASQAPRPVFLRTEDGMGTLSVDAFPVATSYQDVRDALTALFSEKHDYQTVVIDSLSALEPLIWRQVAADANKTNVEDLGYGKGYVMALDYWAEFLGGIITLRDQQNIMPILIAHSEVTRYDSPTTEPFDRYLIRLHKRAFALMYERADIIGFADWQTMIIKDDVGFNKKQARGIGTGERLLHLVERPAYIAKNRYNLPETIPLSWQAFSDALSAAFSQPEPQPNKPAKTAAGA